MAISPGVVVTLHCADCKKLMAECPCIEDPDLVELMTLVQFRIRVEARNTAPIPRDVMLSLYEDRIVAAREGRG